MYVSVDVSASHPPDWAEHWCRSCTAVAEHHDWCEDEEGEEWSRFPQGTPLKSSRLLFAPSRNQNQCDSENRNTQNRHRRYKLDVNCQTFPSFPHGACDVFGSAHCVQWAWECLSPLALRIHSQCIPSSGTSEASERLSLLEPLFWRKINKNSSWKHRRKKSEGNWEQWHWLYGSLLKEPLLGFLSSKTNLLPEQGEVWLVAR